MPSGTGLLAFLVELLAVFAGGLRLLAALDAGALVMLALADLGQYARLGAAALEALECVFQGLALFYMDLRHCISPPSEAAGTRPPRKGHIAMALTVVLYVISIILSSNFLRFLERTLGKELYAGSAGGHAGIAGARCGIGPYQLGTSQIETV